MRCPDGRHPLESVTCGGSEVLLCDACRVVFPIIDGVLVLLPAGIRSRRIELPVLDGLLVEARREGNGKVVEYATNARELAVKGQDQSWEWEDETFWTAEYEAQLANAEQKNWNDRLWQREPLVSELRRRDYDFGGKVIVDLGAGEGQTFRSLMLPLCDARTIYVAVDISLSGLQLNRSRNPHRNSIFVLAPASPLPFGDRSVDVACYFGVLHHTPRKAETLCDDSGAVKPGGYILLHEALERPRLGSLIFGSSASESAHEERLRLDKLVDSLGACKERLALVREDRFHTVLYGAAMRLFAEAAVRSRFLYRVIVALDRLALHTLGRFVPTLRPGEIAMLLQRLK